MARRLSSRPWAPLCSPPAPLARCRRCDGASTPTASSIIARSNPRQSMIGARSRLTKRASSRLSVRKEPPALPTTYCLACPAFARQRFNSALAALERAMLSVRFCQFDFTSCLGKRNRRHKLRQLFLSHSRAEEISLHLIAAEIPQYSQLLRRLDAFRGRRHISGSCNVDHRFHDMRCALWLGDIADEATIDLDLVEREK